MRMLRLAAVSVVLLVAPDAGASERQGFIIGFGVGGGAMTCDGCSSLNGPAAEVHLGTMLNGKTAIVLDGSGVAKTESGSTLYSIVSTVALQYWVAPQVWLKGGVGLGELQLETRGATFHSDSGLGFTGAIGLEVLQRKTFALDLQFRYSTADIGGDRINNFSGVLGFNWY